VFGDRGGDGVVVLGELGVEELGEGLRGVGLAGDGAG